ncbi:DNA-binding protein WhiA [Mycoplasma simbae]|uniref:DNA-binding protein WhiA n=1 Tax=Mycoplasma simbae TaxID=36744 RepID=UPI0004973BC7|nr:DNA-binding protein WhiA [Mycoplasma simbae]
MNKQVNFSQQIKNEIFLKKKNKQEINEFIRGFVFSSATIDKDIEIKINSDVTFAHFIELLQSCVSEFSIKNKAIIMPLSAIDLELKIHLPSAFFAGVFSASGSISNLDQSSYHLQISSNYTEFIELFQQKLNEYYFGFQSIQHKGKHLIYLKRHEKISDFLKAIGAIESMFAFEDSRIQRDFDNSLNRINNVDVANIKKIVNSNQKHIKNINFIFEHNLAHLFNDKQLKLFDLMLKSPEESLNTYSEKLAEEQIFISKSGLNHWLIKLGKVVNEHLNK